MIHIRPKANNKNDVTLLPDGQTITKQGLWLNAKYVTDIVSTLFENRKDEINFKRDMLSEAIELDEVTLNSLKGMLKEEAYTPETFVEACKAVIPGFGVDSISKDFVESLGFRISSPYILNKKYLDSRSYIENIVLRNDYFRMEDTPILSHPFASRMMAKMRSGWRIIEIEPDFYITERSLVRAGITIRLLESYRESVFGLMKSDRFYTIEQLIDLLAHDPLEEYGFDKKVYEGILMRPGKIANLRVGRRILFINGMIKDTQKYLIDSLIKGENNKKIDEVEEKFISTFGGDIGTSDLIKLCVRSGYHFDTDLEMVFDSKQSYLEFIYSQN